MIVNNFNRYPGGKQITTGRGERIRAWLHKRASHTFAFGVTFRAVTFADSRSGWSGVKMDVALGWWGFSWMLLAWKNGPRSQPYRFVTLAEQVRRDHPKVPSLKEQEEREAEEKADEKAKIALFDKQLKEWDARRHKPESADPQPETEH